MSRFIGITRERVFSPGRVGDDRAILERVAERLRDLGHAVTLVDGDDDRWPEPDDHAVIFAMCQGPRALQRLREWEARGVRTVNCSQGILNCQRYRTVAAFHGTTTPFPESVLLETATQPSLPLWVESGGAWVKRGDVHATEPDDVVYVDGASATREALRRFRARGIDRVVVQRHVPGTVLKFYAVRRRFFFCVPPSNGKTLVPEVLRRIDMLGQTAAQILNLEVYGGDCVYEVNGGLTLIDLNDWPSYAPCRAEAAKEIAAHLLAQEVATEK